MGVNVLVSEYVCLSTSIVICNRNNIKKVIDTDHTWRCDINNVFAISVISSISAHFSIFEIDVILIVSYSRCRLGFNSFSSIVTLCPVSKHGSPATVYENFLLGASVTKSTIFLIVFIPLHFRRHWYRVDTLRCQLSRRAIVNRFANDWWRLKTGSTRLAKILSSSLRSTYLPENKSRTFFYQMSATFNYEVTHVFTTSTLPRQNISDVTWVSLFLQCATRRLLQKLKHSVDNVLNSVTFFSSPPCMILYLLYDTGLRRLTYKRSCLKCHIFMVTRVRRWLVTFPILDFHFM